MFIPRKFLLALFVILLTRVSLAGETGITGSEIDKEQLIPEILKLLSDLEKNAEQDTNSFNSKLDNIQTNIENLSSEQKIHSRKISSFESLLRKTQDLINSTNLQIKEVKNEIIGLHLKQSNATDCELLNAGFNYLTNVTVENQTTRDQDRVDGILERHSTTWIESLLSNSNGLISSMIFLARLFSLVDPANCCDIRISGIRATGVYDIKVNGKITKVLCDMETEGGGWTVIQRRTLEGIDVNFFRNWTEYEKGFGRVPKSYWIGLQNIAGLTKNNDQEIRFDMESFNTTKGKAYAKYGKFHVAGAGDKYRLSIGNYSGTAVDSMSYHNNMFFSTFDNDNDMKSDINCAKQYSTGWWANSCNDANANGILHLTETYSGASVFWYGFHKYSSLKFMEIKIRNKNTALCGLS